MRMTFIDDEWNVYEMLAYPDDPKMSSEWAKAVFDLYNNGDGRIHKIGNCNDGAIPGGHTEYVGKNGERIVLKDMPVMKPEDFAK